MIYGATLVVNPSPHRLGSRYSRVVKRTDHAPLLREALHDAYAVPFCVFTGLNDSQDSGPWRIE